MSSPIPGFVQLPPEAVEKWHSQDDIEDPPFKRPLRAMLAHHAAVDRAEAIESEIRGALLSSKLWLIILAVASVLLTVAFFAALAYPLHAGVVAVVGVVSWIFAVKKTNAARRKINSLEKERPVVLLEIEKQFLMSKNLVEEADKKIKDLGPPPPDPEPAS